MPENSDSADREISRRHLLTVAAVGGTVALAGCGGQISACKQTRLQEEREDELVASVGANEYTNEIEFTVNFWKPAGSEENPAHRIRVFNDKGENVGEFQPQAATRSASARIEKDALTPAYIQVYDEDGDLLETRTVEVTCS